MAELDLSNSQLDTDLLAQNFIQLTALLEREAELLSERDIMATKPFQEEKRALTESLEKFNWMIANKPELLNKIPNEQRRKLKNHGKDLASAMEKYERELIKTERVQQLLLNMVRSSMEQCISPAIAYAKNGSNMDSRYKERFTPPVQLNRCL